MADKATGGATEKVPMPVTPVGTATPRAALAGVSGIYIDYPDATFSSLVLDAFAQLPESPGVLKETLLFSSTNSLPDVPQVFHDDHITGLTGIDDSFGDPVVEVGYKAALPPRKPLQEAFGPLRALGLERLPQPGVASADVHGLPPGEPQATGGGGKIVDTTVDADNVAVLWREGHFPVHDDVDVERFHAPSVTEGGRSGFLPCQELALEVADDKGELHPTRHRGDGDFPALLVEGEGALVEAHARGFELLRFGWLQLFPCSFSHTGDGADDEVSLQAVSFLDGAVAEVLEFDLVGGVVFLRDAEDIVAGVGKPPQGLQQNLGLLRINLEFALYCFDKLHSFASHVNRAFLQT